MPFVLGFVGLAAFCVVLFVIVSRKNVALACGDHASIATNSNIKKMGISLLAALLIVGSCASFTKAFADTLDRSKLTGDVEINLNSDYSLNSIVFNITNNTQVDLIGGSVTLLGGGPDHGFYSDFLGDNIILRMNGFVFKKETTTSYTTSLADLPPDATDLGWIVNSKKYYSLEGLSVSESLKNDLLANNGVCENPDYLVMHLGYEGAWNVSLSASTINADGSTTGGTPLLFTDCLDNTIQDYDALLNAIRSSYLNEEYNFVEINTESDGRGVKVDADYLASHPITEDTSFYAIFKEKTASNDAPSADSSAESGTPGDVADTPEVTDPDANAEADASKDNAEATDPAQSVEGTKEGGQAEQTA